MEPATGSWGSYGLFRACFLIRMVTAPAERRREAGDPWTGQKVHQRRTGDPLDADSWRQRAEG